MASSWMIYGANGYTGELIAREAARRGHKPVLAGRNATKIEALAKELGLESRSFSLDGDFSEHLKGQMLVLHCAGPFSQTSEPMIAACLKAEAHYLDITGEIAVFEHAFKKHDEALAHKVLVMPGVGFDVVPTDSLALKLQKLLPDATQLTLAFQGGGGFSPGTLKTMVEGAGQRPQVRKDGRIQEGSVEMLSRDIPVFGEGSEGTLLSWGDLSTAYRTTGIPNIRVYLGMPRDRARKAAFVYRLGPIVSLSFVKKVLKKLIEWGLSGPSEETRADAPTTLWGRVENAQGQSRELSFTTSNTYSFTIDAALGITEAILGGKVSGTGFSTPAALMGENFVTSLPGVSAFREISILLLCLSFLASCTGRPSHEKFPGPPGRTTEIQQAQSEKAVLGGVDPNAGVPVAPQQQAPAARAAADASQSIKGRVDLPKDSKPAGRYFFLSVRPAEGGPPLAVRREEAPKFPYEFTLGADDVMIPGTPFEGEVTVTARLKQDSDPLSRKAGDYSGTLKTKIGDHKIRISLKAD